MLRRIHSTGLLLLALCWSAAPEVLAQDAVHPGPAQVVEQFLTAMNASRWAEAGALLEPAGLLQIRRNYLNDPNTWALPRPMTADDYLRDDPDMPRAVAEWFASRSARSMTTRAGQSPQVSEFGLDSITQLQRVKQSDVLAFLWAKAHDAAYRMREFLLAEGCAVPPAFDSLFRASTVRVYGSVPVDSVTAFVLIEPAELSFMHDPPTVVRVRKVGLDWRIVPHESLLGRGGFGGISIQECPNRSGQVAAIKAELARYERFVLTMAHDSIAAMFTPDGELHTPGASSPVGPKAIAEYLKSFSAFHVIADSMTADSTFASTTAGRQVGSYWQRVRIPRGDTVEVRGRFEARWRKVPPGQWKLSWLGTVPAGAGRQ